MGSESNNKNMRMCLSILCDKRSSVEALIDARLDHKYPKLRFRKDQERSLYIWLEMMNELCRIRNWVLNNGYFLFLFPGETNTSQQITYPLVVSVTSTCTTHCLRVILFLPPWYPFLWNFHYSPIASPLLLIMSWVSSHGFPSWKSGTPTWLSRSAYFNHNRRRTHRAVPRNAGKSSWWLVMTPKESGEPSNTLSMFN